jgi:hypothetical protein
MITAALAILVLIGAATVGAAIGVLLPVPRWMITWRNS